MSVGLEVVIVATTWSSMLTVASPEISTVASMRIDLEVPGQAPAAGVGEYLRVRLIESWPPPATTAARALTVSVSRMGATGFDITIREGSEIWAQRAFVLGDDPTAAKLAAWLFVRSALLRVETSATMASSRSSDASSSPSADGAGAAAGTGPAGTPRPSPAASAAPDVAASLVATASLGPGGAWSAGVALGGELALGESAFVRGEIGYGFSSERSALHVHHLPVGAAIGVRPPRLGMIGVGFGVMADGKLAVAAARRSFALGMSAGPSLHWLPGGGRFLVRVSWWWAVLRQRYVLASAEVVEAPWSAAVAAGVTWP